MMIMDIGLQKKDRKLVSDSLSRVLADTSILSLKAKNYHWNVVGPLFSPLHSLFDVIYEDLNEGADGIAERIRALVFNSPGSYKEFITISAIKEEIGSPEALDMVRQLTLDHELLTRRSTEVMEVATSIKDDGTADLMVERIRILGKHAWMLRSHLE